MREIEFDYICEDSVGTFHYVFSLNNLEFGDVPAWCLDKIKDKKFNIIAKRQFTGLKDCNGVNIYERDIVLDDFDRVMTVVWHKRQACYKFWFLYNYKTKSKNNNFDYASPSDWFWFDIPTVEVIGNEYENKELLEV